MNIKIYSILYLGMKLFASLLLLTIATGAAAIPKLFNPTGYRSTSYHTTKPALRRQQAYPDTERKSSFSNPYSGSGVIGELEGLLAQVEAMIEIIDDIQIATHNLDVGKEQLDDTDKRLVFLDKYVEDDIDLLSGYLKQALDTTVMNKIKNDNNLDDDKEFLVIGNLPTLKKTKY